MMPSDLADMSGSGLGREENRPIEAGDFQGTKCLQKRQRNGLGRWRCNNSYAVQEASLYHPHPSQKSQEGKGELMKRAGRPN